MGRGDRQREPLRNTREPWEGGAEASGAAAWGSWKKFRDAEEVYVIARFCKNPPVRKRYNTSNDSVKPFNRVVLISTLRPKDMARARHYGRAMAWAL